MLLSDFDYELPAERIAQQPPADRAGSRMMVVERARGTFSDQRFLDLPRFLHDGDVLVLNNTRVFPARLSGRTATGAAVEIFLVSEIQPNVWSTLAKPGKRLKPDRTITFDERLTAEVLEKSNDGTVTVRFDVNGGTLDALLDEIGRTPLPPYIKREQSSIDTDRNRYQTVFAKERGAIAAPTAGLHFTAEFLQNIQNIGVTVAEITLHVGYGTFETVRVDDISHHSVAAEQYRIGSETAELLNAAKQAGRRIVAVGTTTARALESNFGEFGIFTAGSSTADLTITPGFAFRAVDALLTNFHLPQSSLLILTSTFGGHELIMDAYRHAVAAQYRFYSYGDCMLIF